MCNEDLSLTSGDLVQIYIKKHAAKRGTWTSSRQILSINREGGFVTVPGRAGRHVKAAFEDVRLAPHNETLDEIVQVAIDEIDERIEDELLLTRSMREEGERVDEHESKSNHGSRDFDEAQHNSDQVVDGGKQNNDDDMLSVDSSPQQENELSESDNEATDFSSHRIAPTIGDRVEVYWPVDDKYYPGIVQEEQEEGSVKVHYDDNEVETLNMNKEVWRFAPLNASSAIPIKFQSSEQTIIAPMMSVLGQRPFLLHQAQGFDQYALVLAYRREEEEYLKNVKVVPRSKVPHDANIISSHTVYKINPKEHESLKLKARVAPHGNEDSDTIHLRIDCAMFHPVGIRIITTVAVLNKWKIGRTDADHAFHQTGPASRQVYVRPARESGRKGELWLLLVAGYGLVNAGAKWQRRSDDAMRDIGMVAIPEVPQLFANFVHRKIVFLAAKIVDDVLLTGEDESLDWFVAKFGAIFKLGEHERAPGKLRFFGMFIVQEEDFTCTIHADEKLNALEPYPLSRIRRRQEQEKMTAVELSAFRSLNSSISWIGTVASPLCAFYASTLQQRLPTATVHDLVMQNNALSMLKRHGTLFAYPRPKTGAKLAVNLVAFADASHKDDRSQLCFLIGLVFGDVAEGSFFHLLSWASHKSRRPVHSTPAAEIIAASEALDDLMMLRDALAPILNVRIHTYLLIDSRHLYTSLTTQLGSVDKSVRPAVNCIRFTFETELDVMGWIRGAVNPSDMDTKENNPLTESVTLMLETGKLTVYLSSQETKSHDKRLG